MKRSTKVRLKWAAAGLGVAAAVMVSVSAYFSAYQTCLRNAYEAGVKPLTAKLNCTEPPGGRDG